MGMFSDVITLYNKISAREWKRTVAKGVQWADKTEKQNANGRISTACYVSLTFPEGTYEGLVLDPANEEDFIVYGEVPDLVEDVKGKRVSDLLKKYSKSGLIRSVNDNSNRSFCRNIKVVLSK